MYKILFICNSSSWGGLEINTVKFASWLRSREHQIFLAANTTFKISEKANEYGVKHINYPVSSHYKGFKGVNSLAKTIKEYKIDVAILCLNQHLILPILCKLKGVKIPFCYLQQMEIGVSKRDIYHSFIYKKLDFWISPLQVLAKQVEQRTHFSKEKIVKIPLCIDTTFFKENKITKCDARKQLGIPENTFIFGMIGRFDRHKGQEYFIRALHKLKQNGFTGKGLIVGIKPGEEQNDYAKYIIHLIEELELSNDVFIKPFTSEVANIFKTLDAFVMPSPAETFGMVTLEALILGIPTVGFAGLGTKEILQDGEYGLLAPPKNVEILAEQMEKLWKNEDLRIDFSNKGKNYVEKNFSKELFCSKIEGLIYDMKN